MGHASTARRQHRRTRCATAGRRTGRASTNPLADGDDVCGAPVAVVASTVPVFPTGTASAERMMSTPHTAEIHEDGGIAAAGITYGGSAEGIAGEAAAAVAVVGE